MKTKGSISPAIGILFILSVLIPGIALGIIGLRAADREEAYIEKRFRETLLVEVMHAISLVNSELDAVRGELFLLFTENKPDKTDAIAESSLVDVSFQVSERFRIIEPDTADKLSAAEKEFLSRNRDFLANLTKIPVYEDLALAYKDLINDQYRDNTTSDSVSMQREKSRNKDSVNEETWNDEEILNQNAKTRFEQSEDIKDKVYEQALTEGKKISYRNVLQTEKNRKEEKNLESVYYSKNQSFSEIAAGSDSGFIPRIIDDRLSLIFWVKTKEGGFSGCSLSDSVLKQRLVKRLPDIITDVRILTILNETGTPLVFPGEEGGVNIRIPFVSREISKDLPRWEAAAYLANPRTIRNEARSIALIMWIFVFMLIVSIIAGGGIILKSFYSGILLAQQKTTFVSNVSHELKTPLTSIRLFAEILREGRQPDREKQKKYLDLMVSETQRLSRLINNVLDFSGISGKTKKYAMEKTDIVALCTRIAEEQKLKLAEKGFAFEYASPENEIMIYADAESIEQALLNIIFNAEKYSPDKKEIAVRLSAADGYVRIAVSDRGIGIPARHTRKIFREFYRVDDSLTARVQGSGLGLSIARKIIQAHKGTIHHAPREGGGSCFIISVPILRDGVKNE